MIRHDSQRGWFAFELYRQMRVNKNIWLLTGDLGYKLFDPIRDAYPNRFINTGAAEQSLVGLGVGLAMEGKIPFGQAQFPYPWDYADDVDTLKFLISLT
jgi:transketolase